MNSTQPQAECADFLRDVLKSQYHAALAMLRQAIVNCPDALWAAEGRERPFWRIAYHTLYFTRLYGAVDENSFTPWTKHQTEVQYLDNYPAPLEDEHKFELPERPPQTGVPYTREEILEYWSLCAAGVDAAVDALDPLTPQSGFSWYRVSKLEHQIVNLRHIQHHAAQLGERARTAGGAAVDWVGASKR